MNVKSNLFAKVLACCLLIVSMAGSVVGVAASAYLYLDIGAYQDRFIDTGRYTESLHATAEEIDSYYQLKTLEQSGDPSYTDQSYLEYLEGLLFPPAGSSIVWALVDTEKNCLVTNLTGSFDVVDQVKSLTGNGFRQIQKENRYVVIGLRESGTADDSYDTMVKEFALAKKWGRLILFATTCCLLLTALLFGFLIAAAGHKKGTDEIVLNPLDRIWTEAVLLGIVLLGVLIFGMLGSNMYMYEQIILILLSVLGLLTLFFSLVRRAKAGQLYRTSLLRLLVYVCRTIFRHIRITARIIGMLAAYILLELLLILGMSSGSFIAVFLFFSTNLSVAVMICLGFIQYHQICKVTEKMAAGELENRINENTVPFFHHIAHNLNSTGEAMTHAVEKATQSERMKTELITNVSHDIKTPLTSIISYVGLLRTTDIRDPKALEYIDVLDRKSRRLGQLMVDLVEASKVTSGNISVNMEVINLGELIKQAGGEFESRLEDRNIRLVSALPETPVFVYADGRHMWRVLDNLFGNASKYALDGTRVYVDLSVIGRDVLISIKNISRDPLNIRPEELMERFVRGDESRNTEGSGLGLSIARSLMELQRGSMNILIDGDLFKVVLSLPLVDAPVPEPTGDGAAAPAAEPDTGEADNRQ